MKETPRQPGARSAEHKSNRNQGEGDKESAERFNRMETNFVQSERGRQAIETAGDVDDSEAESLAEAERQGKSRAKGEDPAVTRDGTKGGAKAGK